MSTLRVTNVQDTAGANSLTTAQIYNGAAKAWVNFNGTGTVAIRANFNVSSITDNGTGDYTVNFTNAMTDVNYSTIISNDFGSSTIVRYTTTNSATTNSFRFFTRNGTNGALGGGGAENHSFIRLSIFR